MTWNKEVFEKLVWEKLKNPKTQWVHAAKKTIKEMGGVFIKTTPFTYWHDCGCGCNEGCPSWGPHAYKEIEFTFEGERFTVSND